MRHPSSRLMTLAAIFILLLAAVNVGLRPRPAKAANPWGPMDAIEKAARGEGKLVVYAAPGHMGPRAQREISTRFSEKYGIAIDWTSLSARDIAPRVLAEQRTQQRVVDVVMSGIAGNYTTLKPKGYVLPILAPSTMEKDVWWLDPASALPEDRDWLFIYMTLTPSFFINTELIPAGERPASYKDLLNPKWKGKIVMMTPARGGAGSGWFRATYRSLGLDYMKALAKQIVLAAKVNDPPDMVARGQYLISIGATTTRGLQLMSQGAPVNFIHPKEGSHLTTQGVSFVVNSPHPNAAMLFINWFYSKEGQDIYAVANEVISLRKDVSQDHLPAAIRYSAGQPLMMPTTEDQQGNRPRELLKVGKEIFEVGK